MLNQEIRSLKPERLWHYFAEILEIPRPSKKEEKMIAYLKKFGEEHHLETIVDETGNVLIRKPATKNMESRKGVILQSHMDMVCEKNSNIDHDFDKDPIIAHIEDGWVKANGTTLGADDGIGMAAQLAILEADDLVHGPLECLFTMDEETGLTGAFGLKKDLLNGEVLLNLDSEDDGELFIGCAGGKDTIVEFALDTEPANTQLSCFEIQLSGLTGGHSGDDIHKGRGNAVKLMNRVLWECTHKYDIRVALFNAGNLRNAIAREAMAVIAVPKMHVKEVEEELKRFSKIFQNEYKVTEPSLKMKASSATMPEKWMTKSLQMRLFNALYAAPHGVIAWSQDIPDFVETSTNLAAVKFDENRILVTTSQRSSVTSAKHDIANAVAACFILAGADVKHTDGYPGWTPNPHSAVVDLTNNVYTELFNEKPKVLAIHAGLECGLIGEKYPEMDMISFGPTIKGAHSPDERLKIDTVDKFWKLTIEVLKRI
ncbi:MAG: aminoacyl-histidine dipeptidase [Bacteroidales bacterium]|nr:aminoacyl-histidine dipeptidase [Bacteroidales bacterium]